MIISLTESNQDSVSVSISGENAFLFQQKTSSITLTETDQDSIVVSETTQDPIIIFV